ncbi:MAG: HD domain-containing protein, partial [Bacteroidales bacterium]
MSSPALQILTRVEDRWLQILYLHDREIFSGIHLPSHDHTHHLRVWQFARELVMVWEESGRRFSMEEIELLILAVFFHDTGMSRTQQSRHGLVSREFCEAFLQENKLSAMAGKAELLDAIEQHDNKDYGLTHRDPTGLLTLLNLADDLDA